MYHKSFIYKIHLTFVINIRLEQVDEQIWHKNKNEQTDMSVSGYKQLKLCQFKIEGYHIQNCILRSVVKRLIWMKFLHSKNYVKFMNEIRIRTNTRNEINKGNTFKVMLGKQIR
jgi:hypothetical protein